jgi:hypothetical protein
MNTPWAGKLFFDFFKVFLSGGKPEIRANRHEVSASESREWPANKNRQK